MPLQKKPLLEKVIISIFLQPHNIADLPVEGTVNVFSRKYFAQKSAGVKIVKTE